MSCDSCTPVQVGGTLKAKNNFFVSNESYAGRERALHDCKKLSRQEKDLSYISFHFFNSLYRVKTSITKITALQLALSTNQNNIEKKTYSQFYVAANV